jgi:xyloglucan-specific endo-beta-1,4-glucanase
MLAATAVASPTPSQALDKRATTMCGSWESLETGAYTVYHNNWGASEATSGSQCTTFTSEVSNSVAWSTSWTWAGGAGHVKSYSNVALESVNKKLSAISTIPTKWTWRYVCSSA